MADDVMVRPARTYLEGSDLVSPETEPYRVSRARAIELRNNGLVTIDERQLSLEHAEQPKCEAKPTVSTTGRSRRAS